MNFYTAKTASDKLEIEMSDSATEISGQRGKASPTEEQDVYDGESNKLTNSDFEPVSSKFTDSSAEKTSFLQVFVNTASKATSPSPALHSSDGSGPPASFEGWCVDRYPKVYTHAYAYAYYCLFLSIVLYIVTFIRTSWSVFRRCTSFIGNLWSVGARPTDIPSEPLPQKRESLQQPIRTEPRPAPIDSISSISGKSWTRSGNVRANPQTLEQQQLSVSQRLQLLRRRAMGAGRKDTISLISAKSSFDCQNGRAIQQTHEQLELSASRRPELLRLRALERGRKDPVPMVCVRRSTTVVEKSVSVGIRPAESNRTGSFSPVSIVRSRITNIVEDFLPSALFSRRNLQKSDGGKGKPSTSKNGFTTGEKAYSSHQFQSDNSRRNPQAGNVATRTNDRRKGAIEHARPKHGSKTGEKASSSKQRQNTDSRREERHPRANKVETRTYDIRKGAFGQAPQKHGPKNGEKASSSKQRQNIDSRRDERGPRAGNAKTHGATTGQKASSNKQRRNTDRGNRA